MKKSAVFALHFGFWLFYILLTVLLVGLHSESQELIHEKSFMRNTLIRAIFFTFIPSITAFYTYYFLVFQYLRKKRVFLSLITAMSTSIVASLIGTFLMIVFLGKESLYNAKESATIGVIFVTFICTLVGGVAILIKGFITWYKELKLKEELQQKNHDMEMALIKAQLDPHFLFNTLNNIDVLILKDPDEASDYLNKLCDIMRYMLYETKIDDVPLAKEIEYIEKYITLQKIRSANINYINFTAEGQIDNKRIAPMLFLPFIENAFKHTSNKKLDNAIHIHLQIDKNKIRFVCKNKFNPNRKPHGGSNGLGNDLIEKRLNLIYPERHTLEVTKGLELYTVHLIIEAN